MASSATGVGSGVASARTAWSITNVSSWGIERPKELIGLVFVKPKKLGPLNAGGVMVNIEPSESVATKGPPLNDPKLKPIAVKPLGGVTESTLATAEAVVDWTRKSAG